MENRRKDIDYTLYLVTDQSLMSTSKLFSAVEQAILGGCTMVQLREKSSTSLDFYHIAKEIKCLTDSYGVPLIINDRIDIALAIEAQGVHIGQSDIPASVARKIIGNYMLLGVSAATVTEAEKAQDDGADYLGIGAMFPTDTKTDAFYVTFSELEKIRQAVNLPLVAIGGINKSNAATLKKAEVDGLAVVSAIISQPDIRKAAEEIKQIFLSGGE